MGFWIVDVGNAGKAYVHRSWKTRREAEGELFALLKPYDNESPWRCRLVVQEQPGHDRAPGMVVRGRDTDEHDFSVTKSSLGESADDDS